MSGYFGRHGATHFGKIVPDISSYGASCIGRHSATSFNHRSLNKNQKKRTMAGTPISTMALQKVIELKQKGTSNRKVADLLKIGRNTVNRYVRQL